MRKRLQTAFQPRQYMLSQDFELYYYEDRARPKVSIHAHDYYEFYFFIDGCVSINIDGTDYPLSKGDMILLPPNVMHHITILDQSIPYQRVVFWITEEYCSELMKIFFSKPMFSTTQS